MKRYKILFFLFLCSALLAPVSAGAYAKVYSTPEETLILHFPNSITQNTYEKWITGNIKATLENQLGIMLAPSKVTIYEVFDEVNSFIGYSILMDEHGKYEPITLMISMEPDLSIKEVSVLVYREKIGSSVRKKRFLKQFKGKTIQDPLLLNQDVDGITGATVSSWSVATAIKKALIIIEDFQREEKTKTTF